MLRAALWRHYGDRRRAAVAAARAVQYLRAGIMGPGAAELLVWAAWGGLWLMLIGWFHQRGRRRGGSPQPHLRLRACAWRTS